MIDFLSPLWLIATFAIAFVFAFLVWAIVMRRMAGKMGAGGGGLLAIGKSKAKVFVETDVKTRF